jgi:DNA-binding MurR/RpiR family transcriptional regulator
MLQERFADRVAARRADLQPAERRVADHFLGLGPQAAVQSAAAIAAHVGTSDATVVRTAKALGYRGLSDLREALAASANDEAPRERLRRTLDRMPPGDVLGTTVRDHLAGLDEMSHRIDETEFQRAAALLSACSRIVWRGVGPSAHLAQYAAVLTQRVGKPTTALVHTGASFADELLSLAPDDAVVVFAYGRPQSHVDVLLERANALGGPVVLVTDALGRRYATKVDTTLTSGRGRPGLFASHGTTVVLIEALVLAVASADRERAEQALNTLNDLRAALLGRRADVDAR